MTAKPAILSLRLPVSVRDQAKKLAAADGISLNAWIASAVAEKNAAVEMRHLIDKDCSASVTDRNNALALLNKMGDESVSLPGDRRQK